jgi:TPR repeat protein
MFRRPNATVALLYCFVSSALAPAATVRAQEAATSPPVAQGEATYQKGDYATALRLWLPAANEGEARAQFDMGVMHANGRGVPQDYVVAHMWFNLSAARGDASAAEHRDTLAKEMSSAQIADAQKMAREWKPKSSPARPSAGRVPHQ